MFAKNSVIVLV